METLASSVSVSSLFRPIEKSMMESQCLRSKMKDIHCCCLRNHHKNSSSIRKITTNTHQYQQQKTTLLALATAGLSLPILLPSLAAVDAEQLLPLSASDKINLESILVSIDNFFIQYPFFVSGVTFIWLVVIPLTQEYLKKCKFISANDAFRKLRDDPNSQLLDLRDPRSIRYLPSPNLKIFSKTAVQIFFDEENPDSFLDKVMDYFTDPANTTLCILDNFDGNSLKVAELLFERGFKEAYAIKGGLRGKNGWQEIQETLLPPSLHVIPKKSKASKKLDRNKGINTPTKGNGKAPSTSSVPANSSRVEPNSPLHK